MKNTVDKTGTGLLNQSEESERRLHAMLLQVPASAAILRGENYVVEMVNTRWLDMWGKKEEEVLNKPVLDEIPGLRAQGIKQSLDEVYKTGKAFSALQLEIAMRRAEKDEIIYINISCEQLLSTTGARAGIIVAAIEVTEHVAAQKKIEAAEEFNRMVLESSPDCLKVLDVEGRLQYMNFNGLCQMEMDDFSQFKSKYWWNLWGKENEQTVKDAVAKALLGEASQFVAFCPTARGTPKWWDVMVSPVGKTGEPIHQIISVSRDITTQKNIDLKISESEKRFRLLADSMPQQIWTADTAGNLNYYNQAVFDYSGLTPEQINKEGWLQIVHPDDREENIRLWTAAITTGKDFLFEHRFRRHGGEYRWQLSRAIPQKGENGRIQMWVGTSTDIQEQKNFRDELEKQVKERTGELVQLTESLKRSEELYHQMVEEVQDYAILFLNREGIVQNWNKGAEKIKGYRASEIIGKSFSNFYTAEDRASNLPNKLLQLAAANGTAKQEGWRVKKDGNLFWASVVITAVHNQNKEIIGFTKVTHDLTDKKASEEILKKSEERYHLMVEEVEDYAILYLNRQGFVENWNAGAEKIKGYKAAEIIGKSFSNFYTAQDKADGLPQKLLQLAERTGRANQEGWRVKKDGNLFWANVVITAVHNEDKEVIGFSKVTHDLTDKKKADDELKQNKLSVEQKNNDLQKLNKELQAFAFISSHDLQEPLRKIQTFASRIAEKEKDNLSDVGKDLFNRMNSSAERMQSLIDDLLAYSRTQRPERNLQKVNISTVLEQVMQDLKEEIENKNAVIEIKGAYEMNIVLFQFRQLFYNLISNSLKFSNPQNQLHISVKNEYAKGNELQNENLEKNRHYFHISIADNGIGFEPQYNERIFELFQRLHSNKSYRGTGIGLAIVQRIVENHNGIITAKGEPGKGTIFDIYLPAAENI